MVFILRTYVIIFHSLFPSIQILSPKFLLDDRMLKNDSRKLIEFKGNQSYYANIKNQIWTQMSLWDFPYMATTMYWYGKPRLFKGQNVIWQKNYFFPKYWKGLYLSLSIKQFFVSSNFELKTALGVQDYESPWSH